MSRIRLFAGDGFVFETLPGESGSDSLAKYVPDSNELAVLYGHWLREAVQTYWTSFFFGACGSSDFRRIQAARWRMETIAEHLTAEEIAQELVDDLVEFERSMRVDKGAPFDIEEILAVPSDQGYSTGVVDDGRAFFKGWARPILDAVAAKIRCSLATSPCDCGTERLADPFVEDDRGHTCERVASKKAFREAFARLVAWVLEQRSLRPETPREGGIR